MEVYDTFLMIYNKLYEVVIGNHTESILQQLVVILTTSINLIGRGKTENDLFFAET